MEFNFTWYSMIIHDVVPDLWKKVWMIPSLTRIAHHGALYYRSTCKYQRMYCLNSPESRITVLCNAGLHASTNKYNAKTVPDRTSRSCVITVYRKHHLYSRCHRMDVLVRLGWMQFNLWPGDTISNANMSQPGGVSPEQQLPGRQQ